MTEPSIPPELPAEVATGCATAKWRTAKAKGRVHCQVCVWLCYRGQWEGTPRQAVAARSGPQRVIEGGPEFAEVLLCPPHANQWRALDDMARQAAKPARRRKW